MTRKTKLYIWIGFFVVILVSIVLLWSGVIQEKFIFQPSKDLILDGAVPDGKEDIYFSGGEGSNKLHGWFFKGLSDKVIVIFHGNAGNISHRSHLINFLKKTDHSIFIFDYSGYGASEGSPSQDQLYEDGMSAMTYLVKEKSYKLDSIVLYGESLGGSVAIYIAAKEKGCHKLILHSCFSSISDIIHPVLGLFCGKFFPNKDTVTYVKCPILSVHSKDDEVVPYESGRKLFDRAPYPKSFFEIKGTHNKPNLTENYLHTLVQFIGVGEERELRERPLDTDDNEVIDLI